MAYRLLKTNGMESTSFSTKKDTASIIVFSGLYIRGEGGLEGETRLGAGGFDSVIVFTCIHGRIHVYPWQIMAANRRWPELDMIDGTFECMGEVNLLFQSINTSYFS